MTDTDDEASILADPAIADKTMDALSEASPDCICGPGFWMWLTLTGVLLDHGWTLGELTRQLVHTAEAAEEDDDDETEATPDMQSPHQPGHA